MDHFYKQIFLLIIAFISVKANAQISVTATSGTPGPTSYTTLKAAFDAINAGTHKGNITIGITGNTTENATAILQGSGSGNTLYTSVLVKPATGITATISGNSGQALVILDKASNVIIDGSNTVNGTTKNLSFSNSSTSGPALVLFGGASNNTIKNSIFQAAGAGTGVVVLANSNGPSGNNSNIIQNNDITKNASGAPLIGIFNMGTPGKPNTGNIYRGNRIFDFSEYGFCDGDGNSGTGFSDNTLVEGNEIYGTTPSSSLSVTGIYLANIASISNMVISKNKIHSLVSASNGIVTGIDIYDATSVTVMNNMISLSNNPTTSIGIGQGTGPGAIIKVYHNTVSLSGPATNSGGAYFKYFTSTGDDVRNNIFVNKRISTTAKQYAIANASNVSFTSNYNNLVSLGNAQNAVGGVDGATMVDYVTLANWQAGTSLDANSTSVDPIFISSADLHLNPAGNGGISNTGTPVAVVTADYDNDSRSTTTPDVGADEFISTDGDQTPPTITYSLLASTCFTTDRILSGVTIADVSGVPTTGALVPRIYYKKSTGSTWFSKPGTLTAGTGINGTWNFTITAADMGTLAIGQTIQYYVIAQDVNATANVGSSPSGAVASNVNIVTTHPTAPNSYVIGGPLSGNYNVGSGQTYPTLTAAVAAYNAGCVSGAVTFTLMDANYANETLPIVIQNNSTASSSNTLTIRPAAGVNATISGNSTVATIQLKGADYVTIDGSNTVGGTTRNLTLSTTSTEAIPVIWLTSGSVSDGANNNSIKNLNLIGNGSTTTLAGVFTGSYNGLGNAAEFPNNNNSILNISVVRTGVGIYIRGNTVSASYDQNWVINGNSIGSTVVGNKLRVFGIFVESAQNLTISKNTVTGIVAGTTSMETSMGIVLYGGINGATISGNKITDIKQMNPAGFGANGINLSTINTAANVTVVNNFVSDVAGQGFAGSTFENNGYGIVVNGAGGYNIYYNTVNMNTNQALATGLPSAFHVTSVVTAAGAINLRNNIFINSQTSGTQRYAISSAAPNTVFGTINYNNYYTTGPNLGFIGFNRATLTDIVTGFGGNVNSKNTLPVFVSATDLHLNATGNTALENAATPIAGITVDIDNDTRSATTPDLGADELSTPSACTNPVITVHPAPFTTCLQQNATFSVTATGTNLTYQWQFNGANIPGATASSFTINNITAAYAGSFRVVVSSGSCSVTSNVANLTVSGPCTSIPGIDEDISSVVLMPNLVNNATTLRVNAGRSTYINWKVVDMNGKVVMTFNSAVSAGQNDIKLIVSKLGAGTYHIMGQSAKGRTEVLRMIKF